jgi:hypothetical protein
LFSAGNVTGSVGASLCAAPTDKARSSGEVDPPVGDKDAPRTMYVTKPAVASTVLPITGTFTLYLNP